MRVVIVKDSREVADYGAAVVSRQLDGKPASVLGLATGSTPIALYDRLVELHGSGRLSFRDVSTFNLDEYLGLPGDHPHSYRQYMNQYLFDKVDIDVSRTFVPAATSASAAQVCAQYEAAIAASGGIDLQLLGIGANGHIGFNEPWSSLGSRTRVKTLTSQTIADNSRFFDKGEYQPHLAITMGIGTILDARRVLLLATGGAKANAVSLAVEGPVSASCPASALQLHPDVTIVIDEAAAAKLSDPEFFRHIEREDRALETLSRDGF